MSESRSPLGLPLVPDRSCGSCNVCCVALTIKEPGLHKLPGYPCRHSQPDHRCGIYADRPPTCSNFYCGWRHLKWVRESLKPDRSDVLVLLQIGVQNNQPKLGVVFMLLTRAALRAEGLAESIAAGIAADVPVYIRVPGPPGYTSGEAQVNEVLAEAVKTRNKRLMLTLLRAIRRAGLKGDFAKIVFTEDEAKPG